MIRTRQILLLAALPLFGVPAALAAEPSSGTVSATSPHVEWTGESTAGGATTIPSLLNNGTLACLPPSCDSFALTVADSADLAVTADAPDTGGFTMIEIVQPDGSTVYNYGAEAETKTTVKIRNAPTGNYEVRIAANALPTVGYVASATLAIAPPPAPAAPAPAPPPSGQPAPAPAEAQAPSVTLKVRRLSARRLNRTRALPVTVEASEPLTDVRGTVTSGRRRVGSGRAASVSGRRTLKLRLARKVKPGRYVVAVSGVTSSGARVGSSLRVRVRR